MHAWRKRTLYAKLLWSYVSLIFLVALVLGLTASFLFTLSFNREVEKMRGELLGYTANALERSVVRAAEKIYLELAVSSSISGDIAFFLDNPLQGNHGRLLAIAQALQDMVKSDREVIDSIDIYLHEIDTLISSSMGIKYLQDETRLAYRQLDWMVALADTAVPSIWIATRPVPDNLDIESAGRPLISYARTLPFASKAKQYGGYVAVHIKAEAITRIMTEVMPDQADQTWLIDEQGRIIAHSDAGRLYDSMAGEPYVQAILAGETLNKTLIHRLDGQTSVVTWHKLSGLGWVLISQTPVTAFYRQSATIRWVLLLITVAAMLIGLILAGYFTSSIYKPFRQSVSRASALSQTSGTSAGLDAGDNELDVIDRTVRCLSGKINELECSLDANKPLIKHQLLSGLMQGQIPTRHDLAGFEAMLGLDLVFPGYVPMSFNLDDRQFAEWDAQQVQLIKIDLVRRFEDLSGETGLGLAAESAPAGLYALLCGQTDVLPVAAKRVAAALIDYAHDELGLELKAAICRRVSDPLTIGQAFAETALYEQYTFFMPELQILTFERIDEREHSCCHLPDHLTENVARALHRRDQAEVTAKVTTLSTDLAQGLYSLAECQQGLICLNQILARFCQSVRYPDDEVRQNAGFGHGRFKDIRYYQAWYLDFTAELFQQLETRQTGKSAGLVRTIKDYVRANLDRDLSLDLIAGHVNLSARYISRLFKAETSINLTEYINQQRLEYAQHLLVQSDWTVDEISVKSGFHTPSYFIQKFRELYGVTPNHYRISHKMM